jgi:flagellar biosynthesis protein FliQ
MNAAVVLALVQQTIQVMLLVSAPPLLAGLVVGLLVSVVQVMTSIQDSTLSLLPRIVAMVLAAYLAFPWMLRVLTAYTIRLIELMPSVVR